MATIVKTPAGRTKRDAEDWSRRAEDEMVRGVYINRTSAARLPVGKVLDRYLSEVTPTKKPSTQAAEKKKAEALRDFFGDYSLGQLAQT